ncbi:MAG: arylamine N-acetyltransferase [Ignavibacteriaceae bacterium]
MDIKTYLARIEYKGAIEPSLTVLSGLQRSHLLSVPFENLDIHYRNKIEIGKSYNKIVLMNRGGFCYELNSLFCWLLKMIGFDAILVSGRAYNKEKGFGPEFDHMAVIVTIGNQKYLSDVGFGEFAFAPLKLELNCNQTDERGVFRIRKYDDYYLAVEKQTSPGVFTYEYLFSLQERQPEEFDEMCIFHQTSKESHFTQKMICSLPRDNGRITLTGNKLKITNGDNVSERELNDEREIEKVLWEYFKIRLR